MSAPEPQVRVNGAWYMCETCGAHMRPWNHGIPGTVENAARAHADACVPLQLARLQARWDARDEAERGLIERWRGEAAKLQASALTHPFGSTSSLSCTLLAGAANGHADELERAIGGDHA